MSVPSAHEIKVKIVEKLPAIFKEDQAGLDDELKMRTKYPNLYTSDGITRELDIFLQDIANGISQGWSIWQSGLVVTGGTVSGSGIGVWTGIGNNSKTTGSPPAIFINLTNSTDQSLNFVNAIASGINTEFQNWATSYKTSDVAYTGTFTATGTSAGNFTATNTPGSLLNLGNGTNPSGLSQNVQSAIDFNFAKSMADQFLDAIENALNELWQNWLSTNKISGLSVSGAASAGTGTGSGTASGGTIQ
jgi:hypothetical protein